MNGIKTITEKSPVQRDALELIKAIKNQRAKIVKKHGAIKVNKIVKGLEAITKLTPKNVEEANKKGANLKLITIKAQEILSGVIDGDGLLGKNIKRVLFNKISNVSYPYLLQDTQNAINFYSAYSKKYPKDTWFKKMTEEMQKKYESIKQAQVKNDASLIYIPQIVIPDKRYPVYKSKTDTKVKEANQAKVIQAYLPYIVMGGVLLLVILSQSKQKK